LTSNNLRNHATGLLSRTAVSSPASRKSFPGRMLPERTKPLRGSFRASIVPPLTRYV
jgi:hypothetical protein